MAVRPGGAVDPASRIEKVLQKQEAGFRRAFAIALQDVWRPLTLDRVATLLEQGQLEEALATLEDAGRVLGGQYGTSVNESGEATAAWLSASALTTSFAFDVSDRRTSLRIQTGRARIIREFVDKQRQAIFESLVIGAERNLDFAGRAREVRGSIGLTPRQVRAVENYRRLLEQGSSDALRRELRDRRFDGSVRRAIQDTEALTQEQIERMVDRYRQRLVRFRAKTIAQTEALRATHEGAESAYEQAIDAGQIRPDQLVRRWVTAGDERVRSSHVRLGGLERAIGETFPADEGPLRFPGDPDGPAAEVINCRCVLETVLSD